MSDVRCPMSDVRCRVSDVRCSGARLCGASAGAERCGSVAWVDSLGYASHREVRSQKPDVMMSGGSRSGAWGEEASPAGWRVGVDGELAAVDGHVVVVPAHHHQVVGVMVPIIVAFLDVVDLEPIRRGASVGDAAFRHGPTHDSGRLRGSCPPWSHRPCARHRHAPCRQ